mgnify:CR=1 FL=1
MYVLRLDVSDWRMPQSAGTSRRAFVSSCFALMTMKAASRAVSWRLRAKKRPCAFLVMRVEPSPEVRCRSEEDRLR